MSKFQPFLAYSASAGSGKTFALSVRYISLLFMGEPSSAILAATFTNKAAAEMRQRVVDSLRDLTRDEAFLVAICDQTGFSREELLAKQPEVLSRFLSSGSYIVTLDSFFASILRSASLEIGLEPDFVTKEQQAETLEREFLDELQANGLLSSLVSLAMDIEDKRFSKIFGLMQEFYKIDPLLPQPTQREGVLAQQEERIETLRARMIKALTEAGAAKRCMGQFETKSIKALFVKSLFEKESLGEHSWFKKSINDEIEALYQALKEALLQWVELREALVLKHIFETYDHYKNALISQAKSTGVLTFDDLSYFTYRLLHESLSKEFLYFKIDTKFKHILLDEFQDTSTLQFLLLKPLIDEIFSGQGQSELRSFFYVGDTKQSLYRFRGGVEELFDKVAERYGITIEQMDTNYRSSKNVVEQVNHWFEDSMEGYLPQKSRPGAREGFVEVIESEALIEDAIREAKRLIELGIALDKIVFLVATNKDGQSLHEACEMEGIDTLLKTSSSLRYQPKIASLISMVSYLYDGHLIDAEALLQRVGRSTSAYNRTWFSPFMQPVEVLDRLIRDFGYFDQDKNLLKLLEFAGNFNDIPTFLEEFDTANLALAEHSVDGATIMTIHGSKGLEFAYVILLDRLGRKKADTSPLIPDYNEALSVERIFYRNKGREYFDPAYAQLLEKKKRSALKDSKNVLYVALTRAIEAMIILKKEKDSVFDALGMQPLSLGTLVGSREQGAGSREIVDPKSEQISLSHYGTQEVVKEEEGEEKDYAAILFGTALHYTLEMLGSFDREGLATARVSLHNRYGNQLSEQQLQQVIMRVERLLEDTRFIEMFQGAKVYREQSISYEGALKQIDLLLLYETHAMVVDYKSSGKYHLKHQGQVRYYQKAIESLIGKRCEGAIIYLLEEAVEIETL